MQLAFLQEANEDLKTAMETTIDMNAIRYEVLQKKSLISKKNFFLF